MRDCKVTLITKYKEAADAKEITSKETELWASKKSVTHKEFYEAYSSNLSAKAIIDVLPSEYNRAVVTDYDGNICEPTRIIVSGQELNIIRVFSRHDYSMEITVG